MMDLFQNLWAMGGAEGAATAAPTDMSQIKVPEQAMDLAGTVGAANSQLQFDPAATPGTDWGTMAKMGLMALGNSQPKGQEQPTIRAPQYQGGRAPEAFKAEDFSGLNMGALQKFAQAPGLLGRG